MVISPSTSTKYQISPIMIKSGYNSTARFPTKEELTLHGRLIYCLQVLHFSIRHMAMQTLETNSLITHRISLLQSPKTKSYQFLSLGMVAMHFSQSSYWQSSIPLLFISPNTPSWLPIVSQI